MSADGDIVRAAITSLRGLPLEVDQRVAALAALARLEAAAMTDEDRRKVEAYNQARYKVKREGFSRAEYVLRAETAEAQRDALAEALRELLDSLDRTSLRLESTGLFESKRRRARAALAEAGLE